MKKLFLVLFFIIGAGVYSVHGQTKNDDILKLLRISGTGVLVDQMVDALIPQFQQLVPDIPNIFWVKFREKINIDDLLRVCVPAYNKHFTHDEIKQLIKFYESPIGKKFVAVSPPLQQELMTIGQKWGEQLGYDIVNELVKEGYIEN